MYAVAGALGTLSEYSTNCGCVPSPCHSEVQVSPGLHYQQIGRRMSPSLSTVAELGVMVKSLRTDLLLDQNSTGK